MLIRGEEWLPSMPLHVFYCTERLVGKLQICSPAIDFETGGNGKLSKRDGDKLGFPVFPLEWKTEEEFHQVIEKGFFPEAVRLTLALMKLNILNKNCILWKMSGSF
jgi:glutamyl-tRNA synthetase